MPALPEVEVLARHLDSVLLGKTIRAVVIHRPTSTRPTRAQSMRGKLVGARLLSLMKPTAFLINTARGPIVVQQDLTQAFETDGPGKERCAPY